jgi:tetratricopeptide (TPR) repeat protein/predicted Ser/Thr protein kinase
VVGDGGATLTDAVHSDTAGPDGHDRIASSPWIRVGQPLGRYMLLQTLGTGGMGVVFLAFDPQLDRRVALKVLRERDDEAEGPTRARLLREARSLARLSHPNVVPVFDVGEVRGAAFVAMEYVEGTTLGAWIRTRKPAVRDIVRAFAQAGRGLVAAHEMGLVHRDFKPDNVIIGTDGRARVLDFGIARAWEADEATSLGALPIDAVADDAMTQRGLVLGTPAYMAPEQHRGAAPTPAADQYSFCVALYEALFGRRPFVADSISALVRLKSSGRIETPTDAPVPRWLRHVVLRGLSPDPAARFGSMADVVARLERGSGTRRKLAVAGIIGATALGIAVAARPAPGDGCTGTPAVRSAWNEDVARGLSAAFARTGAPFAGEAWQRTSAGLDRFAAQWTAEYEDACVLLQAATDDDAARIDSRMECLDDGKHAFVALLEVLTEVEPDADAVSRSASAVAGLPDPHACREPPAFRRLPADRRARARVVELQRRLARALALETAGRFDDAVVVAREALIEAQNVGHAPVLAEARRILGSALERSGDYDAARQELREAAYLALAAGDDVTVARACTDLIWLEGAAQVADDQTEQWTRQAHTALARSPSPLLQAELANAIGSRHAGAGRWQEAMDSFEQARVAFEHAGGPRSANVGTALQNLGIAATNLGRFVEAEQTLQRALEILEVAQGPDHPDVGDLRDAHGGALLMLGDVEGARRQFELALDRRRAALGEHHQTVARSYNSLGTLLEVTGDDVGAEQAFRSAIAGFERSVGEHPILGGTLVNLGNLLERNGRVDEAAAALRRGHAMLTGALPPDHPWVIVAELGLARLELRNAALTSALDRCVRIAAMCTGDLATCGAIEGVRARVLAALGRAAEADVAATTALDMLARAGTIAAHERAGLQAWVDARARIRVRP